MVAFTNDYNNLCDSTTRDSQCFETSFSSCIDQSSCIYVGDKNSCGSAGKTCLQVICG